MNKIITIGREFGSGGRELGRRLAEELQIAYYDKEIVAEISKRTAMSEEYVSQVLEQRPVTMFPITIGRSFYPRENIILEQNCTIFQEQSRIIREMAGKSDCVIVGRCADYILQEQNPIRIFVYAGMESKMKRCREKAEPQESLSDKELKQHIQKVDKNRSRYYGFYTSQVWGDKANYDFCFNTTNMVIKEKIPAIANLLK